VDVFYDWVDDPTVAKVVIIVSIVVNDRDAHGSDGGDAVVVLIVFVVIRIVAREENLNI